MSGPALLPALALTLAAVLGAGCGDDDGAPGADGGVDAMAEDGAADAAPDADPARYEAIGLKVQMEMVAQDVPGATIAILEGGEVTHAAGFGRKHPDLPEPMEPTTLFRVASVTKMMTTVALLQQVEAGTVSLDDLVVDLLPGLVVAGDATSMGSLTVAQLISHTSGLSDTYPHDATPLYETAAAIHDWTYDVYANEGLFMAPPGSFYNYTNPGFVLAGLVTELVTGVPYAEYMHDNVFLPLGMSRTFIHSADVLADGDYATGECSYAPWAQEIGSNRAAPATYDNPWGWPAGGVFTSALELAEFLKFLRAGDPAVLDESLRAEMQTPQVNTLLLADLLHYGFGLFVYDGFFVGEQFYDLTLITHNGRLSGFSSRVYFVPECDVGFVTLASTDNIIFTESFELVLQSLCALPEPVAAPDLDADPADLPDFVGTYHEPQFFGDMIVTQDGTELRIELPAFSSSAYDAVLAPVSKDNYRLHFFYDYDLTFIRGPGGQAEFMRSRGFVGRRVPPGAPPSPPPRSAAPLRDLARIARLGPPVDFPLSRPRSRRRRR